MPHFTLTLNVVAYLRIYNLSALYTLLSYSLPEDTLLQENNLSILEVADLIKIQYLDKNYYSGLNRVNIKILTWNPKTWHSKI